MKKKTEKYYKILIINKKRSLKTTTRKIKSSHKKKSNEKRKKQITIVKEKYLNSFKKICKTKKWKTKKKEETIKIPKNFSMYDKPKAVLRSIDRVSKLSDSKIKKIVIDHSKTIKHDLASEVILSNAVSCLDFYKSKNGARFKVQGYYPKNQKMKRLLRSIGVVREVAAQKHHLIDSNSLKLYKKTSNPDEEISIFSSDRKTIATNAFPDYMNDCLSHISASLEEQEVDKIHKYLGEVLGNAEDHSGQKVWGLVSYLDAQEQSCLHSETVIYNIGKTVYESFNEKRNNEVVSKNWQNYVLKHSSKFTEEQLTLVYAMQQNASSKLDESQDRGQGTKYLIDLFHHFSDECNRINGCSSNKPEMFILSGSSMLKFDGTYTSKNGKDGKMIYALNIDNDLDIPPDPCYILSLGEEISFPGTIIYIRFTLKER
ncbi:hypothetical protein [Shewanella algae]|uniref:hypothetical protein n=1 Tax=Shewanella algae TaxID=38313 RepID=UPI00235A4119|nr:hypothetical protein [Shewanella algae]MDC8854237.1 hypothetical protein [Shewanella algae]